MAEGQDSDRAGELRIAVTGSRLWTDAGSAAAILSGEAQRRMEQRPGRLLVVVHGGATGLDKIMERACIVMGGIPRGYPVDWVAAKRRLGSAWKRAGHDRNGDMLREQRPEVLLALSDAWWQPNGGPSGTLDCVLQAVSPGDTRVPEVRMFQHAPDGVNMDNTTLEEVMALRPQNLRVVE